MIGGGRAKSIEPAGNEAPVCRLHRAHGHEMHARADRLDETAQRHRLHAQAAIRVGEEGKEHGGEILLGRQHARAVRQSSGDQCGERRDLVADEDSIRRDADEARELAARSVDQLIVVAGSVAAKTKRFGVEALHSGRHAPMAVALTFRR